MSTTTGASSLVRLRIVAVNDVYELRNLPKLQTFLSRLAPSPTAVVLAGDFLSPSTLSSIDGGRGMVATLRSIGLTHASLGNHERDLSLPSLRDRLSELSNSAEVINTNLRKNLPPNAEWMSSLPQYSIISSPCQRVRVALLGLLSDEPGIFRDNTFRGVTISNVLQTYSEMYEQVILNESHDFHVMQNKTLAHLCIPMTHQSMNRDRELARHMLGVDKSFSMSGHAGLGLIIGGHEHEPYNEVVGENEDNVETASIRILKSGMDANAASLIDLLFSVNEDNPDQQLEPRLEEIQADIVEISMLDPSSVVQTIVEKHEKVLEVLENEILIHQDTHYLSPGVELSSEKARYRQTSVGGIFCSLIKEELETDCCIINGATIKGDKTYQTGISYADLKKELPFPTKIVVVPMLRWELQNAIDFSRTNVEDGTDLENVEEGREIPRRGYLQVDMEFEENGAHSGSPDDILQVALPRNLLNGFCKIEPLMEIGDRLKNAGTFPGSDDFVPAIDLVVRHSCKDRWFQIFNSFRSFEELDLNNDGVLDRNEVRQMMTEWLGGHVPPEFVVDDMISSIDTDENGTIDMGEFSYLLATMERDHGMRKY